MTDAGDPAAGRGRVLVIDDAALLRAWYRTVLEPAGFVVAEAFNGIEGLEKSFANRFELVIVDVNMPKMDGLSFVHQLRGNAEIADVPVIITSTLSRDDDVAAGYAAGANLYLIKPVVEAELRLLAGIMADPVR